MEFSTWLASDEKKRPPPPPPPPPARPRPSPTPGREQANDGKPRQHPPEPRPAERSQQLSDNAKLKMRAYRNLRYHSDRQSHYERLTRLTNFILVLLGSGSFALAFVENPRWAAVGAAAVTFVASAQLVFDFSRRAKEEDVLKLECAKLVADAEDPHVDVSTIEAAMASLYGRELETYHAVNAMAYNATPACIWSPSRHSLGCEAMAKVAKKLVGVYARRFPGCAGGEVQERDGSKA